MKEDHHDYPSHMTTLWKKWRRTIKHETSLMKEHPQDNPSHKTTLWKKWRRTIKRSFADMTCLMKEHHHDYPSHKTTLWKNWRKKTKRWRDLLNEGTPPRLSIPQDHFMKELTKDDQTWNLNNKGTPSRRPFLQDPHDDPFNKTLTTTLSTRP